VTDKQLSPSELDQSLVRDLSRLPHYSPSRAFAAVVMARVRLPQPRAVVLYRRARAWVVEPRRALALGASYAVAASLALWLAVPWIFRQGSAINFVAGQATAWLSDTLRQAALSAAGWAVSSGITGFVDSLALTGGRLWFAVGTLVVGYASCAVGLHYLLRTPRGKDVALQPSH
jgi:hypothetical protein